MIYFDKSYFPLAYDLNHFFDLRHADAAGLGEIADEVQMSTAPLQDTLKSVHGILALVTTFAAAAFG